MPKFEDQQDLNLDNYLDDLSKIAQTFRALSDEERNENNVYPILIRKNSSSKTKDSIIVYLDSLSLYVIGYKYREVNYKFKDIKNSLFSSDFIELKYTGHYKQLYSSDKISKANFYNFEHLRPESTIPNLSINEKRNNAKGMLKAICFILSEALRFFAIGNYCGSFFKTAKDSQTITLTYKKNYYVFNLYWHATDRCSKFYHTEVNNKFVTDYLHEFPECIVDASPKNGIEEFVSNWEKFSGGSMIKQPDDGIYFEAMLKGIGYDAPKTMKAEDFKKFVNVSWIKQIKETETSS